LCKKKHDFTPTTGDDFYVQLMNSAPDAANDAVETDLPADLSTAGGYTAGGVTCGKAVSCAQTGGTLKLCIADKVITATAAGIGPFQYVVLFNNSAANKDLIGYYNYGAPVTLIDTETFTIDFDDTNGVLTIA